MNDSAQPASDPTEDELRARLAAQPQDAETLRALAVRCAARGRHDEATAWIGQALEAAPEDLRVLLAAAGIRANAGDLDGAEKTYRKVLALRPGTVPAEIGLGQVAETRNNWQSAEEHYRTALKAEADQVDALLGLGRSRLAQGHAEQAVQMFGRATQLYPQHARALANYGQALLLRGTPQVAARPLIRALELDDSLHEVRLLLGHAELGRGQPVAAERAYREALEHMPGIDAYAGLGDALRAQGRFGEALETYAAALAQQPDNDVLLSAHALCLARVGQAGDAVAELRSYVARHPRAESPRLLLAGICDDSGRSDESLAMWREGAERDPHDGLAHAELALRLEAAGDVEGAAAASAGTENDPRGDVALLRARVALRRQDYARAQRELLAVDPRQLPPPLARNRYRLLGLVHDHNERYAEATLAFREAQRVDAGPLPVVADPDAVTRALKPLLAAPALDASRLAAPVLLLGLPGSGVERVAALLADQPGVALREDRFAGQFDLFGDAGEPRMLVEASPAQLAVQARRYARGVERAFGSLPPLVIDWIPAFDARVLAQARRALPGLRAIVVDVEPERAFLDWLAFGFQHDFRINDPIDAARWWHVARAQIELAAGALPTQRVDADALFADPATAGALLAEFLGLQVIKPGPRAAARNEPVGGLPTRFPAGHVERYRTVLAEPFAALRAGLAVPPGHD